MKITYGKDSVINETTYIMPWLNVVLIVLSVGLITVILMQNRSAGISSAFGGGAEGFHVRRGSEKKIHQITVTLALLFLVTAFAHLFI